MLLECRDFIYSVSETTVLKLRIVRRKNKKIPTHTYQGVVLPPADLVVVVQFKNVLRSVACELLLVMRLPVTSLNVVQGVGRPGGHCQRRISIRGVGHN